MTDSTFALDWLSLRARYDGRARAAALEERLRAALPDEPRIVDLASGSAANVRHLAPRLGGLQRWLLVDHDARLLDAARVALETFAQSGGGSWEHDGSTGTLRGRSHLPTQACGPASRFEARVTMRTADLACDLASCLDGADAIVASAFLDLAGSAWLEELARGVVARRSLLLVTLTVDGRVELSPGDPDDAKVLGLFRSHQGRDKGLGAALGSGAADHLARCLERLGYDVAQATSDWELGERNEDQPLQEAMIAGFARAAEEIAPAAASDWKGRRLALVRAGVARMRIGHGDVFAAPPPRR